MNLIPLYVYACRACGQMTERRQRFQDTPLAECPECSGELRRVLQPVGIIFKGSGFYSTDNRGGSPVDPGNGKLPWSDPSDSDSGSPSAASREPSSAETVASGTSAKTSPAEAPSPSSSVPPASKSAGSD